MKTVKIDVYSDICCPWCLIGSARLDAAIALLPADVSVETVFHPFLLDHDTPADGINVRAMLLKKHGVADPTPMWRQIEAEAGRFGVPLQLAHQPMAYNSIDAHSVVRAGRAKGTQRALHRAIVEGYFLGGANISDTATLDGIAQAHGFAAGEVTALLQNPAERAQTIREADEAVRIGVRSVPTMVIGGRHALPSGGASAEQVAQALMQALAIA